MMGFGIFALVAYTKKKFLVLFYLPFTIPFLFQKPDKSRADIRINVFNREFQNSFLGVKEKNIQAKSHERHSFAKALEQAEDEKDKKYKQRIEDVENVTFYPVVFTTKGKRSRKCSVVVRKLVSRIAIKRKQPTYQISQAISTYISFLLLRGEIDCVRGNRSPR